MKSLGLCSIFFSYIGDPVVFLKTHLSKCTDLFVTGIDKCGSVTDEMHTPAFPERTLLYEYLTPFRDRMMHKESAGEQGDAVNCNNGHAWKLA